jgi:hypothetical protein
VALVVEEDFIEFAVCYLLFLILALSLSVLPVRREQITQATQLALQMVVMEKHRHLTRILVELPVVKVVKELNRIQTQFRHKPMAEMVELAIELLPEVALSEELRVLRQHRVQELLVQRELMGA